MKGLPCFRKSQFSMLTADVRAALRAKPEVRNVYLFGIEAHVCILQTALDLVREGYRYCSLLHLSSASPPLVDCILTFLFGDRCVRSAHG